jgi:hypothetical protein
VGQPPMREKFPTPVPVDALDATPALDQHGDE